ncbi:MFS transporter [Sphaerisporangium krabiense]|uniref:MFS family permease n=1 Tax=Sphaerisporangium krabiense TaxID=763782 RepID=A0A7W8Z8I9_9ACTN|nr:MFS transporter [Sphaerisporangium krabiense]MBB5629459.1 MFS family permease [Sphaerisporangium krabiense]
MSRRAGFWTLGGTLLAFMAASSAPSPLYVVYQARWAFSSGTLTAVFAVYALALLVALLTVGGLSDFVGRRPVLLAALIGEIVAMVTFLTADGVGQLLAARVLQGLATGAATGTISAGLVDLQPSPGSRLGPLVNTAAPTTGLAIGALGTGLLAQYAPAPTTLVFALLTAVFVLITAAIALLPDTVTPRPGALASLRPRARVPRQARGAFLGAVPCLIATWALGGLYLSLGPSLVVGVLHVPGRLVGGLLVTVITGAGAVASVLARDLAPRRVMIGGSAALAAGTIITLTGLALTSPPLFFAGAAVAGSGFGASFLGTLRSLAALAAPRERAELFAAVYVVSYLAFSLPAVLAGELVPVLGLATTATAYSVLIIVLALVAVAAGPLLKRPLPTADQSLPQAAPATEPV